ncbi:MAG: hypothetical protein EXS15_02315 [Phycisphaerales bacterium]|nr:hypothetical protein [Phycisphaerales bacterium]
MRQAVAVAFIWCVSSALAHATESPPDLVAASSGTNVWVAVPSSVPQGKDCQIYHLVFEGALGGENSTCQAVAIIESSPIALSASGDQLAILMPPRGSPSSSAVYQITAARSVESRSFHYLPRGRFNVLASIPSPHGVSSFALGGDRPHAIVVGEPPHLLECGSMGWDEIALPHGAGAPFLVSWGSGSTIPWSVATIDGDSVHSWSPVAAASERAGGWEESIWHDAGRDFEMAISGSVRPALLLRSQNDAWALAYATPSGVRKLCDFTAPVGRWTVVGVGEGFAIVRVDESNQIRVSVVDALSGEVRGEQLMIPTQDPIVDWFHLPLLGAVTIGMLMAGFILRPPMEPTIPLHAGWSPLPMFRRIPALAIDLLPGAMFALWVTGARAEELMSMPSWTPDLERAAPACIMIGFTGVWCFIFEVTLRASPGKFIVGGRVVRAPDGGTDMRAGRGRAALRALLKTIVLLAPALGFLAFVHPLQQGLPETLSKTVVAQRRR